MIPAVTGVLASRLPIVSDYFTSTLYPIIWQETLNIGLPPIISDKSNLLAMPTVTDTLAVLPSISGGSLTTVIAYQNYTTPVPDVLNIAAPVITSGTLTTVIAYQTYTDPGTDIVTISTPSISSGTLSVVINYVAYNNWAAEAITIGAPSIVSGSLT
jgi:hypothetical protein